ncbi:hypothetical protein SAMN05216588_11628 [Pseudomonas flavescens]|uniref:Uncharacterized protein n=1 Tax=Phytopseudomonas flavescens TaxID=29435 RepID=A0A1G8K8F1_9GAMM|nr:hypothetical protein [Pseudomonas flavescens]SDI39738.1 hypothetical protein SAMN05216588_11628 [Pseudomonas flavescens]
MELTVTVTAITLLAAAYLLSQPLRGITARCNRPMEEWLSSYQACGPVEQHEMADALVRQSMRLAANMGVQVSLDDLLANGREPTELIVTWRDQLPSVIPASSLPGTPASTIGTLLLIHQLQPSRFYQLLGQSSVG